jgi:hypothetical protein
MGDASPPLHDALVPVAGLVGVFEGEGRGAYPTIAPFRYRERVSFTHVGKPFLAYQQRTWHPEHGTPMHAESGYLRLPAADRVEFVLAHPTGIVEVEQGSFGGGVLTLVTTSIGLTDTAKQVRSLRREFVLDGDLLTYDVWMAYDSVPETHHLHAELQRSR